ncbi:MAG: hypothetical protein J7647_09405 [Cyanobacteria bacterium SBLK]|nr:hypothetical protein [Cyanobacteria bacterium SBLK]
MKENINEKIKLSHIRGGDALIFGKDSDVRRKLSDTDALKRFSEIWPSFEPEIENAPEITQEEAKELLEERYCSFVQSQYSFKQFSLNQVPFVVRITREGVCDQLWSLGAHRDPTRLCIYFEKIEDKKKFDAIANQLQWDSQKLARQLCIDFMQKIQQE